MFKEFVRTAEKLAVTAVMKSGLNVHVPIGRAQIEVTQRRPTRFFEDGSPDPTSYVQVGEKEIKWNQITNAGRDQLHLQGYSSVAAGGSAPSSSGFNFIGLTNTAITPAAGDTTLSGEIAVNGLTRAQGTYAHTASTNTTTIDKTFTATGTQSAQAAALFNASSAGTMNHELTFTQRNLISGDTLQITYTITLG